MKQISIIDIFTLKDFDISKVYFSQYLTVLTIGFVLLYPITKHLFDVLLMTWIVLCVSIWTVYIHPKKQELYPTGYYLEGINLQIGHFILHWIPFLIVFYVFTTSKDFENIEYIKSSLTAVFCILYLTSHDVKTIYGLERQEILPIGLVATLVYFIFRLYK